MPNLKKTLALLVFLVTYLCIQPAFAADSQLPQLQFSIKLMDNSSVVFDSPMPLIATSIPGRFLLVGNFEKVLQETRTKHSKPPVGMTNDRMAGEIAKNALQMVGSISFSVDGKRKVFPIETFAYDKRMDISILTTTPEGMDFTIPKIANSSSKAYLTCTTQALTKTIALTIGRKDFKLPFNSVPQTEAKPENLGFNPNECLVTEKDGTLMGVIRLVTLKQYFKAPFQDVDIIFQPLDSIMKSAQELAANGKVARPRAEIGTIVPGYALSNNPGGLLMISPESDTKFMPSDSVMKLNGQPLHEPMDITNMIAPLRPGDKVTFTVLRNRRLQDIDVVLTEEEKPFVGDVWGFRPQPEYVIPNK